MRRSNGLVLALICLAGVTAGTAMMTLIGAVAGIEMIGGMMIGMIDVRRDVN